jgi:hypothetical protein
MLVPYYSITEVLCTRTTIITPTLVPHLPIEDVLCLFFPLFLECPGPPLGLQYPMVTICLCIELIGEFDPEGAREIGPLTRCLLENAMAMTLKIPTLGHQLVTSEPNQIQVDGLFKQTHLR